MNKEKADSGTIILNQSGVEIGVIKKIYSDHFARLELQNSESIPMDPTMIKDLKTTGRIIKKKRATIKSEANRFFEGAEYFTNKVNQESISILAKYIANEEIKRGLQKFEFNYLNEIDLKDDLGEIETKGNLRGLHLASKTAQDQIIKTIFTINENNSTKLHNIPPEIFVDKLNQEKAFMRIFWNILRAFIHNIGKQKSESLIKTSIEPLLEISFKHLEIEYRNITDEKDVLYWNKRINESIFYYLVYLILSLEASKQEDFMNELKPIILQELEKYKIQSIFKDETRKILESFDLKHYQKYKPLELLHGGIKGFDLITITEKKVMSTLKEEILKYLEKSESSSDKVIIHLRKIFEEKHRNSRDVSNNFLNYLYEIAQFLKKIEYGDSKARDFYSELMGKINEDDYEQLNNIVEKIGKEFLNI
ncbi:MAG: hypothetical protein U9O98_06255 [Asgard group archaeon]|nr:hypothetical protein [Asgard group archaeon]